MSENRSAIVRPGSPQVWQIADRFTKSGYEGETYESRP